MAASVVAAHHVVPAGVDVVVCQADQPGPGLLVCQPGRDGVETPGSGEVEAVQVNKFAIGTVGNLGRAVENIQRLLILEIV